MKMLKEYSIEDLKDSLKRDRNFFYIEKRIKVIKVYKFFEIYQSMVISFPNCQKIAINFESYDIDEWMSEIINSGFYEKLMIFKIYDEKNDEYVDIIINASQPIRVFCEKKIEFWCVCFSFPFSELLSISGIPLKENESLDDDLNDFLSNNEKLLFFRIKGD